MYSIAGAILALSGTLLFTSSSSDNQAGGLFFYVLAALFLVPDVIVQIKKWYRND